MRPRIPRHSRRRRVQPELRHARGQELSGAKGRSWATRCQTPTARESLHRSQSKLRGRRRGSSRAQGTGCDQGVAGRNSRLRTPPPSRRVSTRPGGKSAHFAIRLVPNLCLSARSRESGRKTNSIMRAHRSAVDALKLVVTARLLRDLCESSRGGGREIRCYNFCLS